MSASALLKKAVAFLLLSPSLCFAGVTFHDATGTAGTSGSFTVNFPAHSDGDMLIFAVDSQTGANSGLAPYATPLGWTQLCDYGMMGSFYKIWHTGDATTVTATPQHGAEIGGNRQTAIVASYTGVNQTTPIGNHNFNCTQTDWINWTPTYIRAPAVSPSSINSMLVMVFAQNLQGLGATPITAPAGTNDRQNNSSPPNLDLADKLLSSGSNTGAYYATPYPTAGIPVMGMSVLLSPATGGMPVSTAVIPTEANNLSNATNFGTWNFLDTLIPQDGDLLIYANIGSAAGVAASGFGTFISTTDFTLACHLWRTGDPTSTTITGRSNGTANYLFSVRNYRWAVDNQQPGIDTDEITSVGSAASITLPTMSLAGTNEYLVAWFSDKTATPSFSVPTGLHTDLTNSSNLQASEVTPANPTGTFASTNSNSGTDNLLAQLLAFRLGGSSVCGTSNIVRHRTQWIDQY